MQSAVKWHCVMPFIHDMKEDVVQLIEVENSLDWLKSVFSNLAGQSQNSHIFINAGHIYKCGYIRKNYI